MRVNVRNVVIVVGILVAMAMSRKVLRGVKRLMVVLIAAHLSLAASCHIPGPGPQPTPTPEPTAAPTATPTAEPSASPTPPIPARCPCAVIWGASLFFCLDSNHQPSAEPVEGGWCTLDSTLRFSRAPNDGRGQPCDTPDRIQEICGGRACEPAPGPNWTVTGPDVRQVIDGYQLRLGPLKKGEYVAKAFLPQGAMDQGSPAKPLEKCPWPPGPTVNNTVTFTVQ